MKSIPALAVIIPTLGRVQSVHRLIAALEQQSLGGLEILIVDQNPPGFLDLPGHVATHTIRRIWQEQPNVSKARNIGFVASTTPYVLFLDDDLIPDPKFCADGLSVLTSSPHIQCLCPRIVTSFGDKQDDVTANGSRVSPHLPALTQIKETLTAAMFFEWRFYRASGGCDEFLYSFARAGEDQEFFLRLGRRKMQVWMDKNLTIYHDESVPGGCELRTDPYWRNRQRCIRTWALRRRIHAEQNGHLRFGDYLGMLRSSILNRTLVQRSPRDVIYELGLVRKALAESREVLRTVPSYPKVNEIDHLQPYFTCTPKSVTSDHLSTSI